MNHLRMFSYTARNKNGAKRSGTVEAADIHSAARKIRAMALYIIKLKEESLPVFLQKNRLTSSSMNPHRTSMFHAFSNLGQKDAVFFFQQLETLFAAGVPIHEALAAITKVPQASAYTRMIEGIYRKVLLGAPLSEALRTYPKVFSETSVYLVRSGEQSGSLDTILKNLAAFLARDHEAHERMKSIMLYPIALLIITMLSVTFMTVFVLPTMASMLRDMNVPLPLPTELLLTGFAFITGHLTSAAFLVAALFLFAVSLMKTPRTRQEIDRLLLHIPIFGKLRLYAAWRIILETLSVLIASGMTFADALNMVRKATKNLALQYLLDNAYHEVSKGNRLSLVLGKSPLFPALLTSMIAAGETSGEMEQMMKRAADFCGVTATNLSTRIEALAEPIMMLFIGGIIFFFILSVILPLLGTMDALT